MKMNNYAVADEYKAKFVVPYLGIEFVGWINFVGALIALITIIVIIGFPLSLILGANAFLIAFGIAALIVLFAVVYNNEINNETGRTKFSEFYYVKLKRYRLVYSSSGEKRYLERKKKGGVFLAYK
ncbi:glucan phosphoethanolaminetransferase (alkaline phosphatase superfamily) [Breznakia sp. PF5-3]|uniref:hypothetical protein n=1 Tax=unclassified Breznakia TaxID=2623764 RepID=UPI002404F7CD|nr:MULTISPECIES: hypothetical protein [unclassified Breznakia]MDF9825181.1 glucan phosphoethanolaminetransferase (alkaline phosphatase superfamily) [Breznakia sp. PM6-1]MDF9836039.1 glucan phosphoethanolaminetransferase (alkaline phosphatase superfamily) [Breznakia sp. PF5-3]MDF9838600.1 glucan phosphoethanolaminetransferase (alkaline phosphatase superfamily) [Breznakia sp. PFB2-8]MDF9860631.1 glucan phosphoethanolaminetransferase (alkaline phosphatase superfamily) [Breznakia sp. PH5-24]